MFNVLSDPAIYEFENEPPISEDSLRSRYRRLESRKSEDGQEDWLNWSLRMPNGLLAGYVQATVLRDGCSYIAYELNSKYWRQGPATSGVEAMLAELKNQYGVKRTVAVLKANNFRSEGLLLKLGFQRAAPAAEARYRDSDDEVAFIRELAAQPNAA